MKGSVKVTFRVPVITRALGVKGDSRTLQDRSLRRARLGPKICLKNLSRQTRNSDREDRTVLSVCLLADTGQVEGWRGKGNVQGEQDEDCTTPSWH